MVSFLLILWAIAKPQTPSLPELKIESTKSSAFEGEPFVANFVLYSDQPFEEVEVVRFPEFDGYWSENQALRQGRLTLLSAGKNRFRALIGTYTLINGINRLARIAPMHLLVKRLNQIILSKQGPPILKRIPAHVPPVTSVGILSLTLEENVYFTPNEPTSIRVSVHGNGNFPEIEIPEIQLPEKVEFVSKRTVTSGQLAIASKTFEIIVLPKIQNQLKIPSGEFTYFDFQKTKYQTISFGPILLTPTETMISPTPLPQDQTQAGQSVISIFLQPLVVGTSVLFVLLLTFVGWRWQKSPTVKTPTQTKVEVFMPMIETIPWQIEFDRCIRENRVKDALAEIYRHMSSLDRTPTFTALLKKCETFLFAGKNVTEAEVLAIKKELEAKST